MIKTSYYANYKQFPQGNVRVQISNSKPDKFNIDFSLIQLCPSWDIVQSHKSGLISDKQFEEIYRHQLNENTKSIFRALEAMYSSKKLFIFLCWEGNDKFCHRHIFSKWFKERTKLKIDEL